MKNYEEHIKASRGKTDRSGDILGIGAYARMATDREFESIFKRVANTDKIVPPGIVMRQDENSVLVRTEQGHTLISGRTGSGKTVTVILNELQYWARTKCPVVVEDPKGELLASVGPTLKDAGYCIQVVNLKDPTKGIRVNPLAEITKKLRSDNPKIKEEGELELADIFYEMIVEGTPTDQAYWSNNPWHFICGLTKELVSRAGDEFDITIPMIKVASDMILLNNEKLQEFRETLEIDNPNLPEMLTMLAVTSKETRSGMSGYLQKGLSFAMSLGMIDMLSGNDLDFHAIASGEPIALFIISPDNTNIYDSFVSVILGQMIHTLYSDADLIYGGALPKDALFVLEEFANIPKIPAFEKVITTARSRKIRFLISVQSISQLYSRYGDSADTIIDNCKDWICTAADPAFSRKLNDKLGPNAAGKDVITHNILRCLPPGRPLVVPDRSNPYTTTMFMVEKPLEGYMVESRTMMERGKVNLEKLIFEPDDFDSVSFDDRNKVQPDDFDLDFGDLEPMDWMQSQDVLPYAIVELVNRFNLGDSNVTDEGSLRMALLMHSLIEGVYTGQEIKVGSLMQFQEASSVSYTFSKLIELVTLLISDDDINGSVDVLRKAKGIKKGISKATMKRIIKKLQEDLCYLKGTMDSDE
ncbi:MAG: type IV secretory system conjugative DNA transfer family protein [Candidatus Methanomethylophilaceae archaeon]|nr:type IV secretory system conjugative DNA transfer family protein [Candidatus Methanomethylophilaceae archaeon]